MVAKTNLKKGANARRFAGLTRAAVRLVNEGRQVRIMIMLITSITIGSQAGLITWVPFERGTVQDIGTAPKSIVSGNVGFVNDTFSPVDCFNTAGVFSGSNSFCELQASASMNLLPITITFWLKADPQSTTDCGLVTKYGIASANGYGVFAFGNHVRAWYFGSQGNVYGTNGGLTSAAFLDGQWHHVAVTFDASGGKLYVDGQLNDSLPWGGGGVVSACTTTIPVLIGEYRAEDLSERRMIYQGLIDDVRILDSSMSGDQVRSQYIAQAQGVYDTDGDGFADAVEFANFSNPNDSSSVPSLLLVNINGGLVAGGQAVGQGAAGITMQTELANANILYTFDGSQPTQGSAIYTGPLTLTESCTLRAAVFSSSVNQAATCPISISVVPTNMTWKVWWQNSLGFLARWSMAETNLLSGSLLNPPKVGSGWRVAGPADLDGTGQTSLVLQNTDGSLGRWLMQWTNVVGGGFLNPPRVAPGWRIVAMGDFNNDGKDDLVWENSTGLLGCWFMSGTNRIGGGYLNPAQVNPTWRIVAVADLNGDGKPDLIWQNTTGALAYWLMNGTNQIAGGLLNPSAVDPNWTIVGAGNSVMDRSPYLVWEHSLGWLAIWRLNGTSLSSGGLLNPSRVDPSWRIVGSH